MHHLENGGIPNIMWPPQSPDLNPIENIWLKNEEGRFQGRKNVFKSADEVMAMI